jgi:hypothetical protein
MQQQLTVIILDGNREVTIHSLLPLRFTASASRFNLTTGQLILDPDLQQGLGQFVYRISSIVGDPSGL